MDIVFLFNLLVKNIPGILTTPIGLVYISLLTGRWRFNPKLCKILLVTYAILLVPLDGLIWGLTDFSYQSQVFSQVFNIVSGAVLVAILQAYPFSGYIFILLAAFNFIYITRVIIDLLLYLWEIPDLFTEIAAAVIICGMLYHFFRKKVDYLLTNLRLPWWKLDVFPMLLFCFFYLMLPTEHVFSKRPVLILPAILLCFMTVGFYVIIHSLFTASISAHQEEAVSQALLLQLHSMEMQISNFNEVNSSIKTLRHDLRHFVVTISGCLQNGDIIQAQNVLSALEDNISHIWEGTSRYAYTNEPILDSVLSYQNQQATAIHTAFRVDVILPAHFPVPATDLAILLSNALENAVMACGKIPEEKKRFITISSKITGAQFFLEIANSYDTKVFFNKKTGLPDNPVYGHGFGSQSIQAIAARNGAFLNYDTSDSIFKLQVLFPTEQKNGSGILLKGQ